MTKVQQQCKLKMTSGALGFKVIDPFDWTKDKAIYQRWQMWSEKARHACDAMEGDSEKTKISYFHHWIDSKGMTKIESWKKKKVLISQEDYEKLEENEKEGKYYSEKIESYFTLFELLIVPKSNPLLVVEELHFAQQGSMNPGEFYAHVVKNCQKMQISLHQGRRKSHQGHKISLHQGRRKSHQGHNFPRHEQYKGQRQSHKFDE